MYRANYVLFILGANERKRTAIILRPSLYLLYPTIGEYFIPRLNNESTKYIRGGRRVSVIKIFDRGIYVFNKILSTILIDVCSRS